MKLKYYLHLKLTYLLYLKAKKLKTLPEKLKVSYYLLRNFNSELIPPILWRQYDNKNLNSY